MSKVTWMYNRNGCKTCANSHAFLDANEVDILEIIDCKEDIKSGDTAISVLENVEKLYSAKGKQVKEVNLSENRPSDEELKKLLLGPTGNLRAPTIRVDETIVVGYNQDTYEKLLVCQ